VHNTVPDASVINHDVCRFAFDVRYSWTCVTLLAFVQAFTPLAAAATVGVWAVVLQAPKEVPSIGDAVQAQ
jgi:hypothetical protein